MLLAGVRRRRRCCRVNLILGAAVFVGLAVARDDGLIGIDDSAEAEETRRQWTTERGEAIQTWIASRERILHRDATIGRTPCVFDLAGRKRDERHVVAGRRLTYVFVRCDTSANQVCMISPTGQGRTRLKKSKLTLELLLLASLGWHRRTLACPGLLQRTERVQQCEGKAKARCLPNANSQRDGHPTLWRTSSRHPCCR